MSLIPEPSQHPRDYDPAQKDATSWSPVSLTQEEADDVGASPGEPVEPGSPDAEDEPQDEAALPVDPPDEPMEPDSADDLTDGGDADEAGSADNAEGDPGNESVESDAVTVAPTEPDIVDTLDATPTELTTESSEAVWPGVNTPTSDPSTYDLPDLDRPRPVRDRFVPKWVYIAIVSTITAVLLIAGGIFWYLSASKIAVPDVTGLQLSVARTRLEAAGLEVQVTDRRFSPAPRDEVLEQTPSAGGEVGRGSTVQVVVSAGTEEIVMPDVVGDGLVLARAELEGRGLVVIVDAVPSDVPSDTVLGTTPAAGAIVRTGDSVRVTVAAPVGGSNGLSPYNMQGLGIVLDPAPTGNAVDTTMEIARRLRSLLEASGASVSVLRSATETTTPDSIRAQAASTATGTISIGLSVGQSGSAGRQISVPVTGTPDVLQRSELLASSISSQLAAVAPPVATSKSSTETVLQATRLPWARIMLGSAAAREDQTRFSDPAWADQMARSIYTALGELYGVRE